jgi:hypothetical protein
MTADMMRAHVGPAWALALAGIVVLAVHPAALSAQRTSRVRYVEIAPADAQIQVGQQQVFLANAYDAGNNPIGNAVFAFRSSDPRVATVDANGIAVGVSPGRAVITARTGTGATARSAPATLVVTAATAAAHVPEDPTAAVTPPAPALRPVPGRPTGPGYAAFDRQPAGAGQAEGLVVQPLRVLLVRGESRQLDYMAVTADGQPADRVPILFSVLPGGESVVSVDSMGFLRAAGTVGQATVRATVPGNARIRERQIAVDVRADSVRFSRAELWLTVGSVDTLRVEVPAQGRAMNVWGEFQFSSTDASQVRVSPLLPVIAALAPGEVRILGESPYFSIAATVHVLRPVAFFAATPADSEVTLAMGASLPIAVRALAADTTVVSEAPLRWTLPDSAVARFDTLTRTLRGIRAGETRLAVSAPATRDSSVERVWRIRVVAGGLAIARNRIGLGAGERMPVVVQLLDDRRRPIGPTTDLRWTSTADSVATVADGSIRGLRPGHARLTARSPWDSTVTLDVYVADQLLAPVQKGGRWDLYTFGADSVPRWSPITQSTAVEMEPAWAPDLTRIAYVAAPPDRPASLDLYVADADGADPRRLTADSATVGAPVFVRPSGDRLVFQSNRGGTVQLYAINRDGTGRARLGTAGVPNSHPDVSPDGSKVLFVSLRPIPNVPRNYDIWQAGIDGTGERRMTTSPRPEDSPLFAPDGRSFFYLRDDGGNPPSKRVYRQSVDDSTGATARAVTPLGMFVRAFTVRADGNLLVLTRLERVRGLGDVPHVELYDPATGVLTPVQLGAGEQVASPAFRPATPQPR